jgi:murein L,D-transpeptidase YcbB/YkuD
MAVNLNRPVPVLLLYWTAETGADGRLEFLPDVYGRDPALLKPLNGELRYRKRPVRITAER